MDVMGEAIEIMGAMDGRGACHQQSPCDQPPPALLTQQEHLILRLVEVERFEAKIAYELDKDTPCKGAVSRELLELELAALKRDRASIEQKLSAVSSRAIVEAPMDASYESPATMATRTHFAGLSRAPGRGLRQENNHGRPAGVPGKCRSGTYPPNVGSGAFSEAFIESRGAVPTAQNSPFPALGWPDSTGPGGTTARSGGLGSGTGISYAVTEANRFEHMTAGRPTEEDFARHARNAKQKNRWLLNDPPSGYGGCVVGDVGDCGEGGSSYPSMVLVCGVDNTLDSKQLASCTENGNSEWRATSEANHQLWTSAPFSPDMGTFGGNPGYCRATVRDREPVNVYPPVDERGPRGPSSHGGCRQTFSELRTSRASSWQEPRRSGHAGKRGPFRAPTASSSCSKLYTASYDDQRYNTPPVAYPSPRLDHHRGNTADCGYQDMGSTRRDMSYEEPFSKRRAFRVNEGPNSGNWHRVSGKWSGGVVGIGASERQIYRNTQGTAPAAIAIDALNEGTGKGGHRHDYRPGNERDEWRGPGGAARGVPYPSRVSEEGGLRQGELGNFAAPRVTS